MNKYGADFFRECGIKPPMQTIDTATQKMIDASELKDGWTRSKSDSFWSVASDEGKEYPFVLTQSRNRINEGKSEQLYQVEVWNQGVFKREPEKYSDKPSNGGFRFFQTQASDGSVSQADPVRFNGCLSRSLMKTIMQIAKTRTEQSQGTEGEPSQSPASTDGMPTLKRANELSAPPFTTGSSRSGSNVRAAVRRLVHGDGKTEDEGST